MRLETPEGKKYYCGRLKVRPRYVAWADYTEAIVDGGPVLFFTAQYGTNVVNFQIDGTWYHTSDRELQQKVHFKDPLPTLITVDKDKTPLRKTPGALKKLDALFAGRTASLMEGTEFANGENRDCTVKALMEVTKVNYDQAHARLSKYRKKGKGLYGTASIFAGPDFADFERVTLNRKMTLGTFAKDAIGGRYFVIVRGHALAVINGKVYDHSFKPGRIVKNVFKYIGKNK